MSESHAHHKPVVGIVPTKLPEPYDDGINHYALAVRSAGAKPYLLPVTDDVGAYETIFPHMDGFLLTGGKDIDPVRYGDTEDDPSVTDHLPGREELEHLILCYSDEFDVPIMGICRGMQMLNVFYGGSLHLDLATQTKQQTHFANHFQTLPFSEPSHHVTLEPRGSLARILQTHSTQVNSMHHQGIFELAPELRAAAYDDQGLIEAIEHPRQALHDRRAVAPRILRHAQFHESALRTLRGCLSGGIAAQEGEACEHRDRSHPHGLRLAASFLHRSPAEDHELEMLLFELGQFGKEARFA